MIICFSFFSNIFLQSQYAIYAVVIENDPQEPSKDATFGAAISFASTADRSEALVGVLIGEFRQCVYIDKQRQVTVANI